MSVMKSLDTVIEGCRKGDQAMQRELYERYSARFYALSRRYAKDDFIAKEILVDGFLEVFNNIKKYRGEGSFEGWMHTIFVRKASASYHRETLLPTCREDEILEDMKAEQNDIDRQIDIKEAFVVALRRLSDDDRSLFNVIAIEGYSFPEASRLFDTPPTTLKSRYYKIKQILGEELKMQLGDRYLRE